VVVGGWHLNTICSGWPIILRKFSLIISLAVYVPISRPDTIYVPCIASLWNGYRTGPASGFQFHSLSNHLITKIFASNPPGRKLSQTAIAAPPPPATTTELIRPTTKKQPAL
jgi:hypothetical protein